MLRHLFPNVDFILINGGQDASVCRCVGPSASLLNEACACCGSLYITLPRLRMDVTSFTAAATLIDLGSHCLPRVSRRRVQPSATLLLVFSYSVKNAPVQGLGSATSAEWWHYCSGR